MRRAERATEQDLRAGSDDSVIVFHERPIDKVLRHETVQEMEDGRGTRVGRYKLMKQMLSTEKAEEGEKEIRLNDRAGCIQDYPSKARGARQRQ